MNRNDNGEDKAPAIERVYILGKLVEKAPRLEITQTPKM
jgi:hypothetical protein